MKERGKFVTLEGCEGVGKSTQLRLLGEYCAKNGIEALFTREPGGCDVAEKIRAVILDANNSAMTDMTELLLYCAARRQHTEEVILPALARGVTVFCDRYADSTAAYQGYARGINLPTLNELNRIATAGAPIDCTVFIDVSPARGFARKGGAEQSDRMERENAEFHERVYRGFCAIADSEPERFVRVQATGTKYETHEEIVKKLRERGIL